VAAVAGGSGGIYGSMIPLLTPMIAGSDRAAKRLENAGTPGLDGCSGSVPAMN
jgi:hypothetical protein